MSTLTTRKTRVFAFCAAFLSVGFAPAYGIVPDAAMATGGRAAVETVSSGPTAGEYGLTETAVDMEVKVLGGMARVRREWNAGAWTFFPSMTPLVPVLSGSEVAGGFEAFSPGDQPDTLRRGLVSYERVDASTDPLRWQPDRGEARQAIVATESGYRWENRSGDWISYDANGLVLAYGGRNEIEIRIERDDDNRIERLLDHHGDPAITLQRDGQGRIVRAKGRAGREVIYDWNNGRLTTVTDVLGEQWTYTYELILNKLRLTRRTDPDGQFMEVRYAVIGGGTSCVPTGSGHWERDSSGSLQWSGRCVQKSVPERAYVRETANEGGVIKRYSFANDSDGGRFSRATEEGGSVTERVLDDEGRLVERRVDGKLVEKWQYGDNRVTHIDNQGNETTVERNIYGEKVKTTYPDGTTETWSYNDYGQVTRYEDARGTVYTTEYDDNGNPVRTVEAVGTPVERTTEFDYDQYGQPIRRERWGAGDTPAAIDQWSYDAYGNARWWTDSAGHTEVYDAYNARGDLLEWTDRSGEQWSAEFNAAGSRLALTDPMGNTRKREYNAAGTTTAKIDAEGNRIEVKLNASGFPVEYVNRTGGAWKFKYAANGKSISEIADPDGVAYKREYDESGTLARIVEPDGDVREYTFGGQTTNAGPSDIVKMEGPLRTVEYRYDVQGNMVAEIVTSDSGSDGPWVTRYGYDEQGALIQETDPGGRTTEYEVDALGRRTAIRYPDGSEMRFSHNYQDQVVSYRNQLGVLQRRYQYDARGDRVEAREADGSTWQYDYNANGLRVREVDPKGQVTQFVFDKAGEIRQRRYYADVSAETNDSPDHVTAFTTDRVGRITGYDDGSTSATYQYNASGMRTASNVDFGPFQATYERAYTPAGRTSSVTYPDDETVTYAYDSAGRLSTISRPEGQTIRYSYRDRAIVQTMPGGSVNTWSYDARGRVSAIHALDPAGNDLDRRQYAYDETGNIISITLPDGVREYSYDPVDRVTGVGHPDKADESFSYDVAGNRVGDARTASEWQYNSAGELQGFDDVEFQYDDNGAMTERSGPGGTNQYTYSVRGRLAGVETASGLLTTHEYAPDGRRIATTRDGDTVYTLQAQFGPVAEFASDGTLVRKFGWSPKHRAGIDLASPVRTMFSGSSTSLHPLANDPRNLGFESVWLTGEEGSRYIVTDHIGTPTVLMATSGAVAWKADYSAFGEVSLEVGQMTNPLRFIGQFEDSGTGLYYNHNRYYVPDLGRYNRRDPLRAEDNDYVYAENNPISRVDRAGLCSVSIGLTASCSANAGPASANGSLGGGFTIDCDTGTLCSFSMVCGGAGLTSSMGAGGGCQGTVDVTVATGQACSGMSAKTVQGCSAKAGGVGGGVSTGSSGSGECAGESVTVSGGPAAGLGGSCSKTKCVMTSDCINEPDCCDVPCECGGCG